MPEQMTTFPARFTSGDTFDLLRTEADYPASAGWSLKYAIRGGVVIDLISTASGDNHLIQVPADSATSPVVINGTDNWTPGTYRAFCYAVHATLGRYSLGYTTFTIDPDPTALIATSDIRSHARKVLDAIEAVIEGRASVDQEEITLDSGGGRRSLKRMSIDDLLKFRTTYRAEVAKEEALESGTNSGPFGSVPFSFGGGA